VSVRYDYDSRIGQDTKVNPMTNPAGAESFYGSRAFLEESGRGGDGAGHNRPLLAGRRY